MRIFDSRSQLFSKVSTFDGKLRVASPAPRLLWKNFNFCPHCRNHGRRDLVDRLTEWGPVISRSDGKTFHLVLGDRPLSYPAEKSSGNTGMMSAGFWYVHDPSGDSTEVVVVILRNPPRGGVPLLRHLEIVSDRLAEKLSKPKRLASLYEFDGSRLYRAL